MSLFLGFDLGMRAVNPAAGVLLELGSAAPICRDIRLFCPDDKGMPDRYARIDWLHTHMKAMIVAHAPVAVGYEVPYLGHDPQLAILFGHIGGCIRAACRDCGIPVYALAPTVIKQHLSGSGAADKDAMIAAFARLCNVDLAPYTAVKLAGMRKGRDFTSHIADAGGAAYTVAIQHGLRAATPPDRA